MLSILMVSYNSSELILKCLASIYEHTTIDFEVVIVDNNSPDNSVDVIRQHYPHINLIESKKNDGFAAGVNLAFSEAKGEKILLLNPDTVILDGAIDKLADFSNQYPQNGIWGGVTLNNDHTINTQHAWAYHNFLDLLFSALGLSMFFKHSNFFNNNNYGGWNRDSVKHVDIISGCFFLTSRSLWAEVGGLDETFFMYAEEADFCKRASKLGYRPIVCPDARIIHHGGASHSNISSKMIKLLRGKCEFFNRHNNTINRLIYISLLKLYVWNKYFQFALKNRNGKEFAEWKKVKDSMPIWKKGYR